MQPLSIFDMFKIGVGPSSSHTMGPRLAARRFLDELPASDRSRVSRVVVDLYGSLAKTDKGHGTDIAVQLGLCGFSPRTIDVESIPEHIREIATTNLIRLLSERRISFHAKADIRFHHELRMPLHPTALRLTACLPNNAETSAVF